MLYAKINVKSNHFLFLTSLESPLNKGGSEGVWKHRWLHSVLAMNKLNATLGSYLPSFFMMEVDFPFSSKDLTDSFEEKWISIFTH